jgi:hypothetical protein
MTDSDGILKRLNNGRFAAGTASGPGRKPGTPNATTVDLRMLRERIAASWNRVGGDGLLDQLAQTDPARYLELVCRVLPRDHHVELSEPPRKLELNLYLEKPPSDSPANADYERIIADTSTDAEGRVLSPLPAPPRAIDYHNRDGG